MSLSREFGYTPSVKLSGNKGNIIIFNEKERIQFLECPGLIICIQLKQLNVFITVRIVKLQSYVDLGYESVYKLWELL